MSGHKQATISARAENIRQLSQSEMAIRFVEAGLSELSARLDQFGQQEVQAEAFQAQAAQDILIQTLAQVDDAFGELEQQTHAALVQQQEEFSTQLHSFNEYSEQVNAEKLEQLSNQYQDALEDLSHYQDISMTLLAEKLEKIAHAQRKGNLLPLKWLEAVDVLFHSVEHDPYVEMISPGFINETVEMIKQAQANLSSGYAEAALVTAQNSYRAISQMKMRAEHERHRYLHLTKILRKKLELLEQEVLLNKQVQAFDLRGKPLPDQLTVDEWVDGNLSRLLQKIQTAQYLIEQPVSASQVRKIERVIKHTIPAWRSRLNDLVYETRAEAINSQLRMNIALMVVRSLSSQGYRLVQTQYNDEDMRAEYLAQLIDDEGSQVLVEVESTGSAPETAELNLYTQDAEKRTPHELRQRSLEIQRSMRRAGLTIGDLLPIEQTSQSVPVPRKRIKDGQQQQQFEQITSKR